MRGSAPVAPISPDLVSLIIPDHISLITDGLREELHTLERGSATSTEEGRVQGTGRTEAAALATATVQLSPGGALSPGVTYGVCMHLAL